MQQRELDRKRRSAEEPLVGNLPDYPGIWAAMMISPDLKEALEVLTDVVLVRPFAGATLSRGERELLASAVSAGNACFYCMDGHGAFASALLQKDGMAETEADRLVEDLKSCRTDLLSAKMRALVHIAQTVRDRAWALQMSDIEEARQAGATEEDVQLAILISSAFCMFNRMVEGFRAKTPADVNVYRQRAGPIVENGYSGRKYRS